MLASIFHCKENDGTIGAVLLHQILPETGLQPGGNHSQTQEAIERNAISDKRGHYGSKDSRAKLIPKEAFSACFQQWRHRWEKCVESQGNYFEGD